MRVTKKIVPEYYVLLCARRYAEVANKLGSATTDDDRQLCRQKLNQFWEAGLLEHKCERERRIRRYPDDFRKALIEKDGSIISRPISREETEILRYASSIPPIGSIDELSAKEMVGLADMFEGWAQSDLTDSVNIARLHGWADGLRSLAEAVGENYIPPNSPRAAPASLYKFMAEKMKR